MSVDTIHGLLLESVRRFPDRPAMLVGDQARTYAELGTEVHDLANGLRSIGVVKGDRVAYWGPSHLEAYELLLACSVVGAVFVPANPKFRAREIGHVLQLASPRLLAIGGHEGRGGFHERVAEVLQPSNEGAVLPPDVMVRGLGKHGHPGLTSVPAITGPSTQPSPEQRGGWPALMQFTSGTTGRPKGALVSQRATVRMASALAESFGLSDSDRYFVCNPICHLGGTTFSFLAAISAGACFLTLPTFDADAALGLIESQQCTVIHGIDTHWVTLLDAAARSGYRGKVRACSVGAPLEIVEQVRDLFKPSAILTGYGSTETGGCPIESHHLDDQDLAASRHGRPLAGVTLAIVDPVTGKDLPPGKHGEIRIGGWSLMLGYHDDAEATAAQLDSRGRCRTGDLGFVDDEGYLHFLGRIKNVIRVGGENVAAEEVEAVLQAHPSIRYAVVVPRPDPTRGEVPIAFVVRATGSSLLEEDVLRYSLTQLASFKVPVGVRFVESDELPLTDSGKIARATITGWAAEPSLNLASQP